MQQIDGATGVCSGDEAGLMLEAALKENDMLRHLDLSNNRLSSVAAEAISNGVRENKGLVRSDASNLGRCCCRPPAE